MKKLSDVKYYAAGLYEVTASNGDTVTLGDFVNTEDLKKVVVIKNTDGTEGTGDIVNNVVTLGSIGTNMECTLFAFGRRA